MGVNDIPVSDTQNSRPINIHLQTQTNIKACLVKLSQRIDRQIHCNSNDKTQCHSHSDKRVLYANMSNRGMFNFFYVFPCICNTLDALYYIKI